MSYNCVGTNENQEENKQICIQAECSLLALSIYMIREGFFIKRKLKYETNEMFNLKVPWEKQILFEDKWNNFLQMYLMVLMRVFHPALSMRYSSQYQVQYSDQNPWIDSNVQ